MSELVCQNCGKENSSDSKFCTRCGAKLTHEIKKRESYTESEGILSNKKSIIVGVVAGIIIAVVVISIMKSSTGTATFYPSSGDIVIGGSNQTQSFTLSNSNFTNPNMDGIVWINGSYNNFTFYLNSSPFPPNWGPLHFQFDVEGNNNHIYVVNGSNDTTFVGFDFGGVNNEIVTGNNVFIDRVVDVQQNELQTSCSYSLC